MFSLISFLLAEATYDVFTRLDSAPVEMISHVVMNPFVLHLMSREIGIFGN